MINLLYHVRARKADQVRDVCLRIFAVFNCNIDGYDKALPSHLKSGHDPVSKDFVFPCLTADLIPKCSEP